MPRERKLPTGMWKRGRVYFARFRTGGREIRKRLSTDFRAACEMLNDLRARADKADFGLLDNDYPWAELQAEFLQWARQSVRHPQAYESDLEKFEEYCRVNLVREITPQLIVAFRAWRLAQGVTARTINRQVGTINNLLNKGVIWRRIHNNPITGLKPLCHDNPVKQRRSLTVEEVRAIFACSPPHLSLVWKTLMTTGIRRSELVNMKFRDIDFDRKLLVIPASTAKNHRAREVPLDDEVLTEIAALRDAAQKRRPTPGQTAKQTKQQLASFSKEHVFVTKANTPLKNNLLTRFYAICKRAGIDGAARCGNVDLHALRVSFITLAIQFGGNPKAIQAIVGHASLSMTMGVYAKATETAKRDAINSLPFATLTPPENVGPIRAAHKLRTSLDGEIKHQAV